MIEAAVRLQLDPELRQPVSAHRNAPLGHRLIDRGAHHVLAGVDLVGKLKIGGGDPECGRRCGVFEDLVALAIPDF